MFLKLFIFLNLINYFSKVDFHIQFHINNAKLTDFQKMPYFVKCQFLVKYVTYVSFVNVKKRDKLFMTACSREKV